MDDRRYSAIVLAGGQSSRMGRPKAELPFAGSTMLDHIVFELTRTFDDVTVAVAEPRNYEWKSERARIVIDRERYRGPLSALEPILREIRSDRAFVCSCDVPFVDGNLARRLCDMLAEDDALIPHFEGKLQMLHAVYRKTCADVFKKMLVKDEHRMQDIVKFAKVRVLPEDEIRGLDPDMLSFFNLNTPEDYLRACELAQEKYKK